MSNFKLMSLSVAAVLALSFSGCGSDSDSDGGDSSSGSDPIVAYECEASQSYEGITITMKLGANGNLKCEKPYGYPELQFVDGVNQMEISQIIASSSFTSKSHGNGTSVENLKEGTETIKGTDPKNGSVNCVNTYDVPLPLYVYDADELQNFYLDDYQLLSTTCPDWVNEDDDDYDDDYENDVDEGTYTQNVTVTETSGTVSKISSYMSMQ